MKIAQKLTLGFGGTALLIGVVGYIAANIGEKTLKEPIGESSVMLAQEILDKIDRTVYDKIEGIQNLSKDPLLQESVKKSNDEFEALDNIQEYINQRNEELINNELSQALIEKKIKFYEDKYGYKVFANLFVTNKYGANLAQTDKTADYYQADKQWWQRAKEDGLYVSDVEYDKSKKICSISICTRIDDPERNFSGVIKAIFNIDDIINRLKEIKLSEIKEQDEGAFRQHRVHKTIEFKLLTKDGKIIYSSEGYKILENISPEIFSRLNHLGKQEHIDYFIAKGDKLGEGEELFTYAHSRGYRDYKGLDWILVIEYETKEIFAPATDLRNSLILISISIAIFAILGGLLLSHSFSAPIMKLRNAALEIGKGKLDATVEISSKDEIGDLANAFNKMAADLKKTTTSIGNLNKEIAERKKAEEELRQSYNKLQETQAQLIQSEKLASLGRIVAGIAHEINNPLSVISGEAEMLSSAEDKDEETKDASRIIAEQAKRIKVITGGLLEYSRKKELKLEPLDINNIVEESLSLLGYQVKIENIEIAKELSPNLPKSLGDKIQIQQVFLNIMLNAVQAMEGGGRLTIRTYREEITKHGLRRTDKFKLGQEIVVMEFKDTGKGMDEEMLKKIFEPFFTSKEKSTGLGLFICYEIIENHSGSIEAESKLKEGSTFIVKLPTLK